MPKFLTIGYGDRAGYDRTPQALRDAAHRRDAELKAAGAWVGVAEAATVVRNPQGRGVETATGGFTSSPLPVAGFALIEAADLEEAIRLVSQTPCAVADGAVEVWPIREN